MTDAMEALLAWRTARDRVRRAVLELRTAQMEEMLAEREYLDAKQNTPIQQGSPMAKVLDSPEGRPEGDRGDRRQHRTTLLNRR